jgi:hypothetical protein
MEELSALPADPDAMNVFYLNCVLQKLNESSIEIMFEFIGPRFHEYDIIKVVIPCLTRNPEESLRTIEQK